MCSVSAQSLRVHPLLPPPAAPNPAAGASRLGRSSLAWAAGHRGDAGWQGLVPNPPGRRLLGTFSPCPLPTLGSGSRSSSCNRARQGSAERAQHAASRRCPPRAASTTGQVHIAAPGPGLLGRLALLPAPLLPWLSLLHQLKHLGLVFTPQNACFCAMIVVLPAPPQ